MRIFERPKFFARRLHLNTETGERVERLQNVIVDVLVSRKFVREKCRRRVCCLDERQRMFANLVVPIRMRDPGNVEFVLKTEL